MARKKSIRLVRSKAGIVVVDIQERLLPGIFERERLVKNAICLLKGAVQLGIPVFLTEQYPKGLGRTAPEVAAAAGEFAKFEKVAFSSCGAAGFVAALRSKKVRDVVLCGMEAHVCILQTCLDLLDDGFRVFVVADAVSSRTAENYQCALARMRDAGAAIVSTEMALFEFLGCAGTDEFKRMLELVK